MNQGRYGCLCFLDSGSVEFEVFKKFPAVCVSKSLGDRNHEGLQRLEELIFLMTLQSRNVGLCGAFRLISIPVSLDWLLPRLSYNNHHTNGCIISQVKSLRCPCRGFIRDKMSSDRGLSHLPNLQLPPPQRAKSKSLAPLAPLPLETKERKCGSAISW